MPSAEPVPPHLATSSAILPLPQVGGHAGIMQTSADGSFVFKDALPAERLFYEALTNDDRLEKLRECTPRFYGTLRLQGRLAEQGGTDLQLTEDSLVLENICHYFKKPNILDIKLGTILWDESADQEKRARMEQRARETTSGQIGVRLTGFQVYDRHRDDYIQTTKEYGRSIRVDQLPEGMARFFPCCRGDSDIGLPKELLTLVIRGIDAEVAEVEQAVEAVGLRMVGTSLLMVYEGLESALIAALEGETEEKDDESPEESEDSEGNASNTTGSEVGLPYAVKLIDFAHTSPVPGQGRDEGVMLGLKTTRELLRGRLNDIG